MADAKSVAVTNDAAAQRYEAVVDGELAYLEYDREPGRVALVHTEVPRSMAGRGIGSSLARTALEGARAEHLAVVPFCPFVASYIRRHQEYLALVAPAYRERVTRR
jgi:predicted GNAT family acetyltransferase